MYMNVNSINNNNNNNNINTNNICQQNKHIKFGISNDEYISLRNKDEKKSSKTKRNWIIASACTLGLAIVTGVCYFNGKKIKKTFNNEEIKEKLPKIKEKSLDDYVKCLNEPKIDHKQLAKNIEELNSLLKKEPEEEISIKIINCINAHFKKIIECKNMKIAERIQYLNDYINFTQYFFNGVEGFDEICNTLNANKNLLEAKSKLSKDFEKNNKSLEKILQSSASTDYKKEFIETLLEVHENDNNNIDKILKTILNNTKRNEKEILFLENNITAPLLRMETLNDPSQVMTYLQELTFKNLNNSDKKVDDALLQYEIITKNKIITLIKNLIDNDKLKNYTLDDDKLVYRTSDKTHIFDFNNNSYKISQNTEPIKKKHHQLN